MQLISDGPDIPDIIFKAHDEGRLLFFCGSGISCNLGLPTFDELVNEVRSKLTLDGDETLSKGIPQEEYAGGKYPRPDLFLNYLAKTIDPSSEKGFIRVKHEIIKALEIKADAEYETHCAILKLSKQGDHYRLITTNADHGFINASKRLKLEKFNADQYPRLPIVHKNSLSLPVHLHGLIDTESDPDGHHLIFTSSDFGKAYLVDGRAAKFVTEIFREDFIVLFVGYSLNDPVLRYIVDALAADGQLENCFAFSAYCSGSSVDSKESIEKQWEFKGIKPILYNKKDKHAALHKILTQWDWLVNLYGRKKVIFDFAGTDPDMLREDFDIGHKVEWVRWALNDGSGECAKYFSEMEPPPPVGWFKKLVDGQLFSFNFDEKIPCSFVHNRSVQLPELSSVANSLLPWLKKHLNKRELFHAVIQHGNYLHPAFKQVICEYIQNEPNQNSVSCRAWRSLLNIEIFKVELEDIRSDFISKETLRPQLSPFIVISPLTEYEKQCYTDADDIRSWGRFEVKQHDFAADLAYRQLNGDKNLLADSSFELTGLLNQAYYLKGLYVDDPISDGDRPSIADHPKNLHNRKWVKLYDFVRDSWAVLLVKKPKSAKVLSDYWLSLEPRVFKRFVLYAMTESDLYSPKEIVDFLLQDDGLLLFGREFERERYKLIRAKFKLLTKSQVKEIIKVVMGRYKEDAFDARDLILLLYDIYRSVSKDCQSCFSERANKIVEKAKKIKGKGWKKRFYVEPRSHWVGEHSDKSFYEMNQLSAPELYEFLAHNKNYLQKGENLEEWRSGLKGDSSSAMNLAKYMFKQQLFVENDLWSCIFYGVGNNVSSWNILSEILFNNTSEEFIQKNIHGIFSWFGEIVKLIDINENEVFFRLADLFIKDLPGCRQEGGDVYEKAINHPVGQLTEAIVFFLDRQKSQKKTSLPDDFIKVFNRLFKLEEKLLLYVYSVFGFHLHYMFCINPKWTAENIINKMDFSDDLLSNAIWTGYLYNKYLSPDLLDSIRSSLTKLANDKVVRNRFPGILDGHFISFYVSATFFNFEKFEKNSIQATVSKFSPSELAIVSSVLFNTLMAAKNPDIFWKEQLKKWIQSSWPQTAALQTDNSNSHLAMIVLSLNEQRDDAFELFKEFMPKFKETTHLLYHFDGHLKDLDFSLKVMDRLIADRNKLVGNLKYEVRDYLDRIESHDKTISTHPLFKKLSRLCSSKL